MEVVALALALAACLGLAAACLWLRRELRRLQAALAQQAEEGAARERRLKELSKRIESYQQVNVRMGEALQDLGKQLAPLPDRSRAWSSAIRPRCRSARPHAWSGSAPAPKT